MNITGSTEGKYQGVLAVSALVEPEFENEGSLKMKEI